MKYCRLNTFFRGIFVTLVVSFLTSACSKNDFKSFSELKEEQEDAIERLISEKKLKVITLDEAEDFPQNVDNKVYYKFPNGLYMRVLDKGQDKVEYDSKVALLFKGNVFSWSKKGLAHFDNMSDGSREFTFFNYTYFYNQGDVHFRLLPQETGVANLDNYMCEGLAFPMTKLGNNAVVSLIIPFEIGPQMTYKDGLSLFVERASYTVMTK